jgi:aspartate beta-hydroxylase
MFGRILLYLFKKYISLFSTNSPVLDKAADFPAYSDFDSNWQKIKEEMEAYILGNWEDIPSFDAIDEEQRDLIENDNYKWKVLLVKMYGEYINTHVSPTLLQLVKKHDKLISSATLSCMEAGKHIPPHCGPNKAVLRYTLPLKVPSEGECYLVVDGEKLPMKEGDGIFWDDTYMHEAVNATNGVRIALLLDIKRKMPKHIEVVYDFLLALARKTKKFKQASKAATVKS